MKIFSAAKDGFAQTSKLMGVILIFFIYNLILGLVGLPFSDPANVGKPGMAVLSIVIGIVSLFVFIFLQGGTLGLIRDALKTGASSLGDFAKYGKKYYLKILGLILIYVVLAIMVVLILALAGYGIMLLGNNIAIRVISATVVTIAALIVVTLLLFPIYSLVVDETGPVAALKKGVSLSKNNFMMTLLMFILMLLVSVIISVVVGLIAGVAAIPFGAANGKFVLIVANSIVQSYVPIVLMAAFMSFYLSLEGSGK